MSFPSPTHAGAFSCAAVFAAVLSAAAAADDVHRDEVLARVTASLVESRPAAIESARRDVQAAVDALRRELDERAIGAVLHEELEVDRLAAELARPTLDADALGSLERPLRRVLAGTVQATVGRLRAGLVRLTRLVRLDAANVARGRQAAAVLVSHSRSEPAGDALEGELRTAFETLSAVAPARHDLEALRRRVSLPNASTLVSHALLEQVSRSRFEHAVDFRETAGGATIAGTGRVAVSLSATAPPSSGANRIILHATGSGAITTVADRRRVHVRATAAPRIAAAMEVRLLPDRIDGGTPRIDAAFESRLAGLGIDGVLGRCRIVQRLAARAITEVLAANDPVVARRIEREVAARVEEEAHALAHRINGLLRHGLWDRLAALDYEPDVRSWNDAAGLHAETFYAHDDELGALRPPPAIPPSEAWQLDVVSRVHESAINNTLASLGGLVLDENTVRGIWEVQLKLTCTEWERLPPGRVPAVLTLADHDPATVRLRDSGIDVVLRATSCAIDGRIQDEGQREVRFRYRLERDAKGVRFVRQGFDFGGTVPADKVDAWDRTLGLFFGREIAPMPRYRPAGFSEHLRTTHIDLSAGWLTVGGARVDARQPGTATVPVGEVRR